MSCSSEASHVGLKIGHKCTNGKAKLHPMIHDIMNNKAVHLVYIYIYIYGSLDAIYIYVKKQLNKLRNLHFFYILNKFLLGSFETTAYFCLGLTVI